MAAFLDIVCCFSSRASHAEDGEAILWGDGPSAAIPETGTVQKLGQSPEHQLPPIPTLLKTSLRRENEAKSIIHCQELQRRVIGRDHVLQGPYGIRRLVYADYTASGRSLEDIENYIAQMVLPTYANTHTEASATSAQTTLYRENARHIIHRCVGAGAQDVVIFTGSGATAAINKIVDILGLRSNRITRRCAVPKQLRPVVFVGPYEHHSNELPWRDSLADVVVIPEDCSGQIDCGALRDALIAYRKRPLCVGSFSAASNVTGILSDVQGITSLLKSHGALSCWDYAAAAPHVRMAIGNADAIFFSGHKFPGGPGTPGVLVVKRELLSNKVPSSPGGGTVAYVGPRNHMYITDPVHREEGGTPAIIESIRLGLVFRRLEAVGIEYIEMREQDLFRRTIEAWKDTDAIAILGNIQVPRLSIVSFTIKHERTGRYLHHNFVVTLLNDLFGIQARGGCSCAGPYGHRLLGIDQGTSKKFACAIMSGFNGIKPGWARLNFNYFIADEEFVFILDAVKFIAEHGYKFLPDYSFDPVTGLWAHSSRQMLPSPMTLEQVEFDEFGQMRYPAFSEVHARGSPGDGKAELYRRYLMEAKEWATRAKEACKLRNPIEGSALPASIENLRWFLLPGEALAEMQYML